MATGRRAFDGESPARVTAAILTSQPPALTSLRPAAPPALERLVEQLLVKDPDGRMESAHDLGLRLRSIAEGLDDSAGLGAPAAQRKRRLVRRAGASLVALLVVAFPFLAYLAAKQRWQRPIPSYQRVTFRRGVIWGARFAPDGQTIVYGATWDGQPIRLFSARLGSPESSPLNFPDADLMAVSSLGELAISPGRIQWGFPGYNFGTLARVHLAGGAPREVLERVPPTKRCFG
jgi:eukaryotic-like serine/threonine-protein kinase